jgi:hypothetical protein
MSNRVRVVILMAMGLICVLAMAAYAADINFAGNWKGETSAAPPPAAGAGAASSRGGGRGGGFGGGGTTKVSLNLKQSKENKLSGNITFGEGNADDVKEGKVEGDRMTFSAGRAPQPIYAYTGEMKGDELVLTRIAPLGDRGPRTTEYVLKKKK